MIWQRFLICASPWLGWNFPPSHPAEGWVAYPIAYFDQITKIQKDQYGTNRDQKEDSQRRTSDGHVAETEGETLHSCASNQMALAQSYSLLANQGQSMNLVALTAATKYPAATVAGCPLEGSAPSRRQLGRPSPRWWAPSMSRSDPGDQDRRRHLSASEPQPLFQTFNRKVVPHVNTQNAADLFHTRTQAVPESESALRIRLTLQQAAGSCLTAISKSDGLLQGAEISFQSFKPGSLYLFNMQFKKNVWQETTAA